MEEAEEDLVPPFWLQTSDNLRRADRRRRSPANMFLNSGVLLATLIVVAGIFIFVIVPSFLSFTSQIFKPHSVKKSWDSLNLVLVAFAIICGFLSRNSDGGSRDPDRDQADLVPKSDPATVQGPDRWYGVSDRTVEYRSMNRMRSSRSYSDLGLESSGVDGGDRWRFHDDTYLQGGRAFGSDQDPVHGVDRWRFQNDTYGGRAFGSDEGPVHGGDRMGRREVEEDKEDLEIKNVVAESFVVREHEATSFRPPVPSSPTPPAVSLPPTPERVKPAPKRAPRKTSMGDSEIGRYSEVRKLRPPPPEVVVNPAPEREYHYATPMKRNDEVRPPLPPRPEVVAADPAPPNRNEYPEISGRRNFEELLPPSPPPPAAARPRAPPSKAAKRKGKRAYQADGYEERRAKHDMEAGPSQPPPPAPSHSTAERNGKVKKRGATKKLWTALNRKKKTTKPKEKSVENLETFSSHAPPHAPPPPPPPPPFAFSNLFSPRKNNKTKKIHSVPPPPPPPPLAAHIPNRPNRNLMSQSQSQAIHVSTRKPPLPVRTTILNDETPNTGNLSPMNSIPPPPPPPPFSYQAWRFKRQGDFVRVNSDNSSRSGSPELEDVDDSFVPSSTNTPTAADGGDSAAALFCPSPDVDTKADTFIARFRAGLNLEKMNSVRVRSKSNLGRESSPDPGPSF